MKNTTNITKNTPVQERRILIVGSDQYVENLKKNFNWKDAGALYSSLPFALNPLVFLVGLNPMFLPFLGLGYFLKKYSKLPYPVIGSDEAKRYFKFPPNHPKESITYSCCDFEPETYVPISIFHEFMFQKKLAAFQELCANLGVKEGYIDFSENHSSEAKFNVGLKNIQTGIGKVSSNVDFGNNSNKSFSSSNSFSFPKPTNKIQVTTNPWLNTEPTWQTMQNLRIRNKLEKYTGDFQYIDDMGINIELATKLEKVGFNIGGNFSRSVNGKFKFNVTFWD